MNKEIKWHVINSLLAGALVFLGSLSSGDLTIKGAIFALVTSCIVIVTKFRDYWVTEEKEYKNKKRKKQKPQLFQFF